MRGKERERRQCDRLIVLDCISNYSLILLQITCGCTFVESASGPTPFIPISKRNRWSSIVVTFCPSKVLSKENQCCTTIFTIFNFFHLKNHILKFVIFSVAVKVPNQYPKRNRNWHWRMGRKAWGWIIRHLKRTRTRVRWAA